MANEKPDREIWSDDLKARLRSVGERYDGKYAMEPVYRFEIALDGHPAPLVGEAVVSEFTSTVVTRKAEEAGQKKAFGVEYGRFFDQYVQENGVWYYCSELDLPWRAITKDEIEKVRDTFARLYFEISCLWFDLPEGSGMRAPRVGRFRLVHLYFAPGGLPFQFHAVITTRDVATTCGLLKRSENFDGE